MTGIWAQDGETWRPMVATHFADEEELHNLVERTPAMLPLAGRPSLAMVGREVRCGSGSADLVAVETDSGRPVVIEIKLASNTDRRQVLTQVLGYAAYLRRLDFEQFTQLLSSHLAKNGHATVAQAAASADTNPDFTATAFDAALADSLDQGRLRCVVVIDVATPDLVELVGYLQEVSNDRLSLDLVTISAYDVGGQRVLVPQLVEPDPTQVTNVLPSSTREAVPVRGTAAFVATLTDAGSPTHEQFLTLLHWAEQLETDGLAVLYSTPGKGRSVLTARLPGQQRGLVGIWNDGGPSISPYRTVFQQVAPAALLRLDQDFPTLIGQGNSIKTFDDTLLDGLRQGYVEAQQGTVV